MYDEYWKLTSAPFAGRIAVQDHYASRSQQTCALRLRYCFANGGGLSLLPGASGVGKSSLLKQVAVEETDLTPFYHCVLPTLPPQELLSLIVDEYASAETTSAPEKPWNLIRETLERSAAADQHAVIAFDEAHLLSQAALNEVVLPLTNLAESHHLPLTVILCGHPVLISQLSRNAQLKERVVVTAALEGLTAAETSDYITTALRRAGRADEIFTSDALDAIFALSHGNIRRINRLCDMALLVGFAEQRSSIEAATVQSLESEFLPLAA